MLINFSNHPSENWSDFQKKTAIDSYQTIYDISFPSISPEISEDEIIHLAQNYARKIIKLQPSAVHIMGEMNFTHQCVSILKSYNIKCIASTSVRNSIEGNNSKTSIFEFVQFREYK